MGRSNDIPDRYANHQRPDAPNFFEAVGISLLVSLSAAIFPLPVLFCAYFIIAFFDQKMPDIHAFRTFWYWTIGLASAFGAWTSWREYQYRKDASRNYERGFREWQAEAESKRQAAEQQQARDVERKQRERLELQQDLKVRARRARLGELEMQVLKAQAQHVVRTDFFGAESPAALLVDFRQHLARLNLADLGLLRESRDPAVLSVVGDGKSLPPAPPPGTPFKEPVLTMGEYYRLLDDSA